jgi:hypothetical protein
MNDRAIKIRMSLETKVGTISEKHSIEFLVTHEDFIEPCLASGAKALRKASEGTKK